MESSPPGFQLERLVRLMRAAIDRCALDLHDIVVLTEAASGAYSVTPVLAAMAGARRVFAVTRASSYGTAAEIAQVTLDLARQAMVAEHIEIVSEKQSEIVREVDLVTNSGHVRPIDAEMVGWMKPTAVVALMYEAWEMRAADVDLEACRRRGIAVAGTNERHAAIDVFSFLGSIVVRLLADAGIAAFGSRLLVLCDNPFRRVLRRDLRRTGACVEMLDALQGGLERDSIDAIVVALRPQTHPVIGPREAEIIARRYPGAIVVQFWGDLDRKALAHLGVAFWPVAAPPLGHQGILLSSIGPEPIVRLQAGGLKVGEVMTRARRESSPAAAVAAAVTSGFGQRLAPSRSNRTGR